MPQPRYRKRRRYARQRSLRNHEHVQGMSSPAFRMHSVPTATEDGQALNLPGDGPGPIGVFYCGPFTAWV